MLPPTINSAQNPHVDSLISDIIAKYDFKIYCFVSHSSRRRYNVTSLRVTTATGHQFGYTLPMKPSLG